MRGQSAASVVLALTWAATGLAQEKPPCAQRWTFPVPFFQSLDWSPDGAKLVFSAVMETWDAGYHVYVIGADASEVKRLTRNAASDTYPDWSPDGTHIVFASNRDGNYEIYVMNADGTAEERRTHHPGNDYNPAWSPSGAWIVFEADRSGEGADELYLLQADGTAQDSLGEMLDLAARKVTAVAGKSPFYVFLRTRPLLRSG